MSARGGGSLRRLPIESTEPMVVFAVSRLAITLLTATAVAAFGFPYGGRLALVVGLVAVPWSWFNLVLARRNPDRALSPLIALGDIIMLTSIELAVPETYGPVRFSALAFLAVHAHFQGEQIGAALGTFAIAALVTPTAIREGPARGELLAVYEIVFAASALLTVTLVGRFRTVETASRLRARELTRRTLLDENEIRRQLAQSLHDGPVQELIGLDMALVAARQAADRGDAPRAAALIGEARTMAERNIQELRGELIDLGPYAFEEISFEVAVERQVPLWERRYGVEAELLIDQVELRDDVADALFRVTQEAVVNAARHSGARNVCISLRQDQGGIALSIADDGSGFPDDRALAASQPGHIGIQGMRERAALVGGELRIESTATGTKVIVELPATRRGRLKRRS